ncbi:hypothetical protein, partial [Collinsella aerofaciens]|uniref:hypothetical protein n=1 Tax=Collinsella aerofaciens TaxID=74426 RepID=UPI0034A1E3CF
VAEPDGVPQEAWIRLGAVQEIVRTPKQELFHRNFVFIGVKGAPCSALDCYSFVKAVLRLR